MISSGTETSGELAGFGQLGVRMSFHPDPFRRFSDRKFKIFLSGIFPINKAEGFIGL